MAFLMKEGSTVLHIYVFLTVQRGSMAQSNKQYQALATQTSPRVIVCKIE